MTIPYVSAIGAAAEVRGLLYGARRNCAWSRVTSCVYVVTMLFRSLWSSTKSRTSWYDLPPTVTPPWVFTHAVAVWIPFREFVPSTVYVPVREIVKPILIVPGVEERLST